LDFEILKVSTAGWSVQVRGFVDHYLQPDGVFVLRLIGHNTNGLTVTELLGSLWDNYRRRDLETPSTDEQSPAAGPSADEKPQRSNDV